MRPFDIALTISRFVPAWVSSVLMAGVFLSAWIAPEIYGWQELRGLESLVFIEVTTVVAALYIYSGLDEPLAWLPILPTAVALGIALWLSASTLVALILPAHLLVRVTEMWSDQQARAGAFATMLTSVGIMAVAWLGAGLLPLPSLGWAAEATPLELWWEIPTWEGMRRSPSVIPVWGLLYFSLTATSDVLGWPNMVLQRYPGPAKR